MSGHTANGEGAVTGSDDRKLCFVVMGFGKKTDYETGRTFDLDATYEAIIEPAVTGLGLRCIRADEVLHSGVIDRPMFEMLYRADLVVADISTGNVNAVYELGVRHALRPNSTIIMKESEGRLHFDLNHVNTFQYEHLGKDIGAREAVRAQRDLGLLISEVLASKDPDSPVYTFLPTLRGPSLSDEAFAELVDEVEAAQERLTAHIRAAQLALRESRAADAAVSFGEAAKIKPDEPYLLQQLALATYKSEQPSKLESLLRAWTVLAPLDPDNSNDPETLGLAGAIRKRLHEASDDFEQLNLAIRYYGRGFEVARDYYNGENLATLFDRRAGQQADPAEAQFDRMSARKVRESIVAIIRALQAGSSFDDRTDHAWIFATMANALFALGQDVEAQAYEDLFLATEPPEWEAASYHKGKADMRAGQQVPPEIS